MANLEKPKLLAELKARYGSLRKLAASQSLFELGDGAMRLYLRYSKLHKRNDAFYGLRKEDLQQLEGIPAVICFLWDGQIEPLFVPFSEYEEVFRTCSPALDGQYKVMVYPEKDGTEIYIAKAGRFNAESYYGYQVLDDLIDDICDVRQVRTMMLWLCFLQCLERERRKGAFRDGFREKHGVKRGSEMTIDISAYAVYSCDFLATDRVSADPVRSASNTGPRSMAWLMRR